MMAMSMLSSTMGIAIIETMKMKTTRPKSFVLSKDSRLGLPNSSMLTMSYKVENADVASRGDSHVASASGSVQVRMRSRVKAFQVARMLMSMMKINHLMAFTISTMMRM